MQSLPFDPYKELEVDPGASPETIHAAWKSLLRRNHPDRAPDPGAAVAKAKRLNQAHDLLTDPVLRAAYDLDRARRARASSQPSASMPGAAAATPPAPGRSRPAAAAPTFGTSGGSASSTPGPGPGPRWPINAIRPSAQPDAVRRAFVRIMGSKAMSIVGVVTAVLWLQVAPTYYSSDGIENDVLAL